MTLYDLRKIAEAATFGEWEVEFTNPAMHGIQWVLRHKGKPGIRMVVNEYQHGPENAEFIATFNPTKVLELLDEIEQLQAVVRDQHDDCVYQTRIAAVEKLHTPVEIEPSDTICGHCSFQLPNGKYFGKIVEYPCDTIKAVRGE